MSTAYAPTDHPGTGVPEHLRDWNTPWSGYAPVDITPGTLRDEDAARSSGWAQDTCTDPAQVSDWQGRLAAALVPYQLDEAGRPLNPIGRTGRTGRNLKSWGENTAADPLVVSGTGADLHVLLIRRGDIGVWGLPGGMVDPGESAQEATVRELHEEAGIDLRGVDSQVLRRGYVTDWRNTDRAWVCSTLSLFALTDLVPATAGDDAADAAWWPWPTGDLDQLARTLAPHGGLYEAHRPLLAETARVLAGESR